LGVDLSEGYLPYLAGWHEVGCPALEGSPQLVPDAVELRRVLKSEGPDWILRVFSKMFEGGRSIAEHLASRREQIEECLDASPLFINACSGSDAWTLDEEEEFYLRSTELEAELGVALSHETHRARYLGSRSGGDLRLDGAAAGQAFCRMAAPWIVGSLRTRTAGAT
jgi:hypothetical protein